MKQFKNGKVTFDSTDLAALKTPAPELTEGQVAFLEFTVGMPIGTSQTPEGQKWLQQQKEQRK